MDRSRFGGCVSVKLVAIETATDASSVALTDDRRLVASSVRVDRRGHGEFLVSALDFCFDQAGWTPEDIEGVIVDIGPGMYTGIRVGLATAQGLAAMIGVPIVPVSSLDALALRAATGRRRIWAVVNVRRGELAVSSYQPVPGGVVKEASAEIVTYEAFRGMLESASDDLLVVGDTEGLPSGFFNGLHRVKIGRPRFPSAEALVDLAVVRFEQNQAPAPEEIRPMYLREADVQISSKHLQGHGPWGELLP
jgi:tRNA threonylcarbamoyladenosine biosynthesis protein TsaB